MTKLLQSYPKEIEEQESIMNELQKLEYQKSPVYSAHLHRCCRPNFFRRHRTSINFGTKRGKSINCVEFSGYSREVLDYVTGFLAHKSDKITL